MSTQSLRYRPFVQPLEDRRLMAADVGVGEVAATQEEPAAVARHFDPALGVELHLVNNDSIWMDLGYPVKAGNTAAGRGGGILNDGGTQSVRAGGGIETNNGALDITFSDAGSDPFWVLSGLEIRSAPVPGADDFFRELGDDTSSVDRDSAGGSWHVLILPQLEPDN